MSKKTNSTLLLPAAVERHLKKMGEDIRIARKRRKESLATFANRLMVSIPTLMRLEHGDPSVSMGIYATALWLIGKVHFLSEIASPETDETALLQELQSIKKSKGK